MAYTEVLERETVQEKETKQREIALAEAKHTANRHEAYMRSFGPSAATQVLERPVAAPVREKRAEMTASNNTITLSPAQKNRALFMELDYKDGMLIDRNTAAPVDVLIKSESPAATVAPVAPAAPVATVTP
ncbi:MAG: hypothetical protein K2N74_03490, partial [Clostridiales bacterium]|nr:hypothetical protein [Clostridiales bacterium]